MRIFGTIAIATLAIASPLSPSWAAEASQCATNVDNKEVFSPCLVEIIGAVGRVSVTSSVASSTISLSQAAQVSAGLVLPGSEKQELTR